MRELNAMLRNRTIKDAFTTLKANTQAAGYHQTYAILKAAEWCWQRECNAPPKKTVAGDNKGNPNVKSE